MYDRIHFAPASAISRSELVMDCEDDKVKENSSKWRFRVVPNAVVSVFFFLCSHRPSLLFFQRGAVTRWDYVRRIGIFLTFKYRK